MKKEEYQKSFIDTIKIIAKKVVSQSNLDKTIKATILFNDGGGYKVKSDLATFTAYSISDVDYQINQKVWILIPQGDFNNTKFILGEAR